MLEFTKKKIKLKESCGCESDYTGCAVFWFTKKNEESFVCENKVHQLNCMSLCEAKRTTEKKWKAVHGIFYHTNFNGDCTLGWNWTSFALGLWIQCRCVATEKQYRNAGIESRSFKWRSQLIVKSIFVPIPSKKQWRNILRHFKTSLKFSFCVHGKITSFGFRITPGWVNNLHFLVKLLSLKFIGLDSPEWTYVWIYICWCMCCFSGHLM